MLNDLVGNKTAEKDIRDWLSNNHWYGNGAKFIELELHAIQRPGWLQVFRFTAEAKSTSGERQTLFGVLRDDERFKKIDVEVFDNQKLRDDLLKEWSACLISAGSTNSKAHRSDGDSPPFFTNVSELLGCFLVVAVATGLIYGLLAFFRG